MPLPPLVAMLESEYGSPVIPFSLNKNGEIENQNEGDNGSVSFFTLANGQRICVKSISLTNGSAYNDPKVTRQVYAGEFNSVCYKDDKKIYFTFPFFAGSDLQKLLDLQPSFLSKFTPHPRHKLAFNTRLEIYRKFIQALFQMHAKGVIHRDLKAANVLVSLSEPLSVHIIDFGRSVFVHDKTAAYAEDLSLNSVASNTQKFFYPFWKIGHKFQSQTAPEYAALFSHWNGFNTEAEGVGFRSDYYAAANLFLKLLPESECVNLAKAVINTDGHNRNHAFGEFLRHLFGEEFILSLRNISSPRDDNNASEIPVVNNNQPSKP